MGITLTLEIAPEWEQTATPLMLATLSGDLCLLLGLALLLLPLLAVELRRPRDRVWGAVVLLLGLVLVTSTDRLRGAPMLAVLCAGLLIARLGSEVGQARWNSLSETEQQRFTSLDHWRTSLQQLLITTGRVGEGLGGIAKQLKPAGKSGVKGKKWVRPESPETTDESDAASAEANEVTSPDGEE